MIEPSPPPLNFPPRESIRIRNLGQISGFLDVRKLIPPKRRKIKPKIATAVLQRFNKKGARYRPIKTAVSVHPYFSDHQEENEQDENKKNEKPRPRSGLSILPA